MTHPPEIRLERGQRLEDEFFRRQDARLLARLRAQAEREGRREALSRATGITNRAVLSPRAAGRGRLG